MSNLNTTIKISDESIDKAKLALEKHGINVIIVEKREQALQLVKEIIPAEVDVMTGSSTTLIEIGFMDLYLSDKNPWHNLGTPIFQEKDKQKQFRMRRKSVTSEYFIASVNAITESGLLVAVDGTGSRVGAFPFGTENLILVSGVNKIVPTLDDAFNRIRNEVFPLENERATKRYGHGTSFGKWVIIENEGVKDRITLILVKEELGF